jgi:DNA (cytosine-5)-methyltransferase 1
VISTRTPLGLLDLYCCAGGSAAGYVDAGFNVFGIDILPQPKYPYGFYRGDAIEFLYQFGEAFDAIHASPPCQEHSNSTNTWKAGGKTYQELIGPTREALIACGVPYVIENVSGAPLKNPVLLCGTMFNRPFYRHRLFETSFPVLQPEHPVHVAPQVKMGRAPKPGEYIQAVGHFSGVPLTREAMGISWMGQKELAQAIPPVYTEYIGTALMNFIRNSH